MTHHRARILLLASAALLLAAALSTEFTLSAANGLRASATARQPGARMKLGEYVMESERLEGSLDGPFELFPKVTVTGAGLTITCDRLKVWPAPEGQQIARAEAQGNIVIRGQYTASDRTEWQVLGKADSASYDRKSNQAVLLGAVDFQATNTVTGAVVSVQAHKLTYDFATRRFQFERGPQPVRVEWQEPEPKPAPPSPPGQAEEGAAKP